MESNNLPVDQDLQISTGRPRKDIVYRDRTASRSGLSDAVPETAFFASKPNNAETKTNDFCSPSSKECANLSSCKAAEVKQHLDTASSLNNDGNQNHVLATGNDTLGVKSLSLERKPECLDLHSLIKDLENRNKELATENEKLLMKLGIQNKVNTDLKKLLVASVGEDIGTRLEELTFDKAEFDTTVTNLESRVEELSEELGRVSIECDVWRTKFLASRMMTSGLTDIKTTLFMKHRNCQTALQKLLEEQSDIRQHLRATNRLLQGVYNATNYVHESTTNSWKKAFEKSSIIELAHVNYSLAEDICHRVNPGYYYATVDSTSSAEDEVIPVTDLTPAERMACQVLKTDPDGSSGVDLVMQKMGRQYIGNSYASRFLTNNFRVTFDCCDRCTGGLKVV